MTMKAIAVPFPSTHASEQTRTLLAPRNEARRAQPDAAVMDLFDTLILEAYGLALTETQSSRQAERITNLVVDRLATAIGRDATVDEAKLRSLTFQTLHRELAAFLRRRDRARSLRGFSAGLRHLFLAGSLVFAAGYALVAGAL
jgi:hypothetical protein